MTASGASSDSSVPSPPRRGEERADDVAALGACSLLRGRLLCALHFAPCAARQLADGGIRAAQDCADLVERIAEDIV